MKDVANRGIGLDPERIVQAPARGLEAQFSVSWFRDDEKAAQLASGGFHFLDVSEPAYPILLLRS